MRKIASMTFLLAAAAIGCSSSTTSGFLTAGDGGAGSGADGGAGDDGGFDFGDPDAGDAAAGDECKKMDIVFVVDNSGSMGQEQSNLATNFPKFVQAIEAFRTKSGAPLDYRVAVTTTDISVDRGAFRKTGSGCSAGPARPWLEKGDPSLATAFSCRATVGTSGSSAEQPLTALKMAFTDRMTDGANKSAGVSFIRDDALLAFVIITDEDESNGTDVATFLPVFDAVKQKERGRWASALIAGPSGGCTSPQFGSALDATRLRSFITQVGTNGVFSSICAGDLTPGLNQALGKFQEACQNFPPIR